MDDSIVFGRGWPDEALDEGLARELGERMGEYSEEDADGVSEAMPRMAVRGR